MLPIPNKQTKTATCRALTPSTDTADSYSPQMGGIGPDNLLCWKTEIQYGNAPQTNQ